MLKKLFFFLLFLCVVVILAAGGILYNLIVVNPGKEIRAENINSILGKESPVYFNDGKTRLGVFFDEAHRQYIPYNKIPVNFINALVASEDNRFFSHFGFDLIGISRAALANIRSGRIVQGGSTLTQQTAKNLFKRTSRSYEAKLKELLFALRLEYHYPKEKIFEFYANQFYVSGNGHGLGVAARYYFNKKPEELNLLECAYIAGSVKRPNYYNPFLKKTGESVQKAKDRGKLRVNYVLSQMFKLGMISDYQYSLAKLSDIPFNKGQVGYSLDYAMEMVKDAVSSDEVTEALEMHDIDNIATSGVRIITTVNKNLQIQTLYSLRHELSRLDVRLRGYEREEIQQELEELQYGGDSKAEKHAFLFGRVKEVIESGEDSTIIVDLGRRKAVGTIDFKGIERLVEARVKWQKNPWVKAGKDDYKKLLNQILAGDKIWVSVREISDEGTLLLDLEKFPQVNGGALVIRDGRIIAVAGGVENRFFNRAISAKRTMGSSFKPFVFSAALQLGWNATDKLRNTREVFVFQNQAYFPRPDHISPHEEVSMSWAGVHSENVASVWLLANLCSKLTREQFLEVAEKVNLVPYLENGKKEKYSRFKNRIRDRYGIQVNRDILRHAAFSQAVKNVETDLIFIGRDIDFERIKRLHYGMGFEKFRDDIKNTLFGEGAELRSSVKKELRLRLKILENSFLDLETLRSQLDQYRKYIDQFDPDFPTLYPQEGGVDHNGMASRMYYNAFSQKYIFASKRADFQGAFEIDAPGLKRYLESLDPLSADQFWKDIYLADVIAVESFDALRDQVGRELLKLGEKLPYSLDVLEKIPDYRTLVGLRFLVKFARELGINSDLEPVLSFPLGSNVVTLLETLRVYEGIATGDVWLTGNNNNEEGDFLSIIERIESAEGEVVYEPVRTRKQVVSTENSMAVGHILENTVKFGTGRYADRNIKLRDDTGSHEGGGGDLELSIPVLGKTGTANRYTNASFYGFLPMLARNHDSLTMGDGFAVGVYVGFDNNKEMKKGATRIAGSAGALPTWTSIVNAIISEEQYFTHLDPVELSFNGLELKRKDIGQHLLETSDESGGVVSTFRTVNSRNRYQPSILSFGELRENDQFFPLRQFMPYWMVSESKEQ